MKTAIFFTIVALTIALANSLAITNPIATTSWKFGQSQTVEWITDPTDSGSKDLYLFYTKGTDPKIFQGTEYVAKITVPDVTAKSAKMDLTTVNLQKYPATSKNYFLRFGDVSGSYSALFTITGGSCTTCTENPSSSSPITPITNANSTISRTTISRTLPTTMKSTAQTSDALAISYSVFAILAAALLALL